jgi:diguanylate cyclase (GGDEF)-like protein/PAS domain S-box-containing protein
MTADTGDRQIAAPGTRVPLALAEEAQALVRGMPDGMLLVDRRGRILLVNGRLLSMTGHAEADLVGAPVEVLVPTPLRGAHVRHRRVAGPGPIHRPSGTTGGEFSVRRADGTTFPADIGLSSATWADRELVVVVVTDLTARRRAEEMRSMQFTVTRVLSDATSLADAGPRLLDVIGRTLEMSSGDLRLMEPAGGLTVAAIWSSSASAVGRPAAGGGSAAGGGPPAGGGPAARGRPAAEVTSREAAVLGEQAVAPAAHRTAALSFGVVSDGRVNAVFRFFSETGPVLASDAEGIMRDIGDQIGHFIQRRQAEAALEESIARLAEVAATDPLTGIRNRREFDRMLATVPRRRFAVLAVDVDNLKRLNDEFGHEAGDVALRAVASSLVAVLRGWDIVARTGGDEFSMLMADVTAREAARAAERVRNVVRAISVSYGQVSISVGWATGPAGADPRDVLDLADSHLYEAKRAGRDRVVGGPMSRRTRPARRSEWSARIEEILARRNLTILYQPIVRLGQGTVIGHEALARPPGFGPSDSVEDLFAEAHRTGRIRDIDWLCRRLAVAAVPWPVGDEWTLFLNVSAVPLLDPVHDVDQMLLLLEASGAPAHQVVLEITERELISDLGRVREVLAAYREHGFRFALDDVGEGHSTLELLAAARPEFIKIARSLTMTASHSSSRAAIRAAVAFAQVSGAAVIGEGIENEFAAGQMAALGVGLGQGMWLGRPGRLEQGPHEGELVGLSRGWRPVAPAG